MQSTLQRVVIDMNMNSVPKSAIRLASLVIAIAACLALVLSGCVTSAKTTRPESQSPDAVDTSTPSPASSEPEESPEWLTEPTESPTIDSAEGSFDDNYGQTLENYNQGLFTVYTYGQVAESELLVIEPDYYWVPDSLDPRFLARQEPSDRKNRAALEEMGYTLVSYAKMSISQAELQLAYDSDLFSDVDVDYSKDYTRHGVVEYMVTDADGYAYVAFVPSLETVTRYGMDGDLTSDFCFYKQPPDGGNGRLYHNLTPQDAFTVFYGDDGK